MLPMYFELPPGSLPAAEQDAWTTRLRHAEDVSGIRQAGMPLVTAATMTLLGRYVVGALTWEEFLVLQRRRLDR